jgi:hypothetical protein
MSASLNHTGLLPLSNADRQRHFRELRAASGLPPRRGKSGKSGKKPTMFDMGEFVAVDGEGFSEGPELTWNVGVNNREYKGRSHYFALLAASDGSEIYSDTRLSTKQCLDFLLDIKINNPKAVPVIFSGGYDVAQILAHGLTPDQVKTLIRNGKTSDAADANRTTLDVTLSENGVTHDYRIELRQRKCFSIWRWEHGQPKYRREHGKDGTPKWVKNDCASVTLWDVWGFFQDSFVGVMDKWIPDDPDYNMIKREKGNRNIFDRSELTLIKKYNQAELRCLVEVMNKLRVSIGDLGLKIRRWDGAGAIAAAMMALHDVKAHMAPEPAGIPHAASGASTGDITPTASVFDACRHAYSGGHIEMVRMGYHEGKIFHYDVNSAYPDQFRNLPSLANGKWLHGTGTPPEGFTIVHVAYDFADERPFYPLFFRNESGTIIYPQRGSGWYWYAEYEAAREFSIRFPGHAFMTLEWWHFEPASATIYPFRWVEDYYTKRMEIVAQSKLTGVPDGREKIIKLGLNSLYGKTVQQVGARINDDGDFVPPPFFQLSWGGYVTAGCRAKLMQAAMQNPDAIISFATDGLFSTEPLDLDTPKQKVLGAWEFDIHDGMTMVMPGVYWLHEDGKKPKHFSRGFDKRQMSDAEIIHTAWKQKRTELPIKITRLIGLGSGSVSPAFWAMRGMFVESERSIALDGDNSKRYPVMLYKEKPWAALVKTAPIDQLEDLLTPLTDMQSAAYEVAWMAADGNDPRLDGYADDAEFFADDEIEDAWSA